MNARVGNIRVANIVGTNGEATLNSNSRKLIDFCTFNNLKILNTFFKHKENFIIIHIEHRNSETQMYFNIEQIVL
jgi:hypothetical protein